MSCKGAMHPNDLLVTNDGIDVPAEINLKCAFAQWRHGNNQVLKDGVLVPFGVRRVAGGFPLNRQQPAPS